VKVDALSESPRSLRELCDETSATVQLSIMDGTLMPGLLKEEGNRAVCIISNVGSRVPVSWVAAGRRLVLVLYDGTLVQLPANTTRP
jgi:DNA-binding IclR family transcriptional regulator